jgi:cysteinyl-tRNA synthetase
LTAALPAFKAALCADLNVSGAIGTLNEAAGRHDTSAEPPAATGAHTYADELRALKAMDSVLGVLDLQHQASLAQSDLDVSQIELLIARRNTARATKDWAAADRLRDELLEMGVAIKDGPNGTTWSPVVSS